MNDDAKPTIHVFGSLNMDLVCQAPHLPKPGETTLGTQFQTVPGGKGANQAVAAARLGAKTTMVGRVGDDDFGQTLIDSLKRANVDTHNVIVDQTISTGVASIVVDEAGNNQIVVVPGANGRVEASDVERLRQQFCPGDFLLLQFEIPLTVVIAAAKAAQEKSVTVIVDPAPTQAQLPEQFFQYVHIVTPNHIEASDLVGFPVTDRTSAIDAAQALIKRGVNTAVIKLGANGAVIATEEDHFYQSALPVAAIDTVAAGDAFNGGLALALAEGMPLQQASQFASAVAAYSVTQRGAQTSMPNRAMVKALMEA